MMRSKLIPTCTRVLNTPNILSHLKLLPPSLHTISAHANTPTITTGHRLLSTTPPLKGNHSYGKHINPLYFGLVPLIFGIVASCEEQQPPAKLPGLAFQTGVCVIPHPEKAHKGGEDAYFISDDSKVLGVADGVGGWSRHGVDPALYSKALMEGAKAGCGDPAINRDPVKLMRKGYEAATKIKGSSTCCIVLMDDGALKTANLGDSGFMVVRDGSIVHRSKEQQHRFNFPYQLGGLTSQSQDLPEHSDQATIKVSSGDIVILGSDGLWDNLYDNQIVALVKKTQDPTKLANLIGQTASEFAHKREGSTPFSDGALKASRIRRPGGKVDDITVLVGRVTSNTSEKIDDDEKIIAGVLGKFWAKL